MKFNIKRKKSEFDYLKNLITENRKADAELTDADIAQSDKDQKQFERSLKSLRLARKDLISRSEEEKLYVQTYNAVIDAKLQLREDMHTNHKFRKTDIHQKVNDFDDLSSKYSKTSLRSVENILRRIAFDAISSADFSADYYSVSAFIMMMLRQNINDFVNRIDYEEHVRNVILDRNNLI